MKILFIDVGKNRARWESNDNKGFEVLHEEIREHTGQNYKIIEFLFPCADGGFGHIIADNEDIGYYDIINDEI